MTTFAGTLVGSTPHSTTTFPAHALVSGLAWIVSVQRLPVLYPECRGEYTPSAEETQRLEQLLERHQPYGDQVPLPVAGREVYYREKGCSHCQFTGRRGDIAILDVCQVVDGEARERLPFELCLWELMQRGQLALHDLFSYEANTLHHLFHELKSVQIRLGEAQGNLDRTTSELQAARRVLNQRNQALFSFQDIGYALIRSEDLTDLAGRVCRHAGLLCGAERAILYILRAENQVEAAAWLGWEDAEIQRSLEAGRVFRPNLGNGPVAYGGLPPGVSLIKKTGSSQEDQKAPQTTLPKGGLFITLVAQEVRVGARRSASRPAAPPG